MIPEAQTRPANRARPIALPALREDLRDPEDFVLHLVNHGTHHRGQVSGFLRAMGHTPPPLDLIAYYRTIPASG